MKITRLIWLDYFVEKLARKHSVSTDEIARTRGVSTETLINLWLQEKAS
jgi:hypothetical protein